MGHKDWYGRDKVLGVRTEETLNGRSIRKDGAWERGGRGRAEGRGIRRDRLGREEQDRGWRDGA